MIVLDRAHVFAMPSRLLPGGRGGEGFGIVYLEAGAHELPCVAGNVGGSVDAVMDGETGLLVDPTGLVSGAQHSLLTLIDGMPSEMVAGLACPASPLAIIWGP